MTVTMKVLCFAQMMQVLSILQKIKNFYVFSKLGGKGELIRFKDMFKNKKYTMSNT